MTDRYKFHIFPDLSVHIVQVRHIILWYEYSLDTACIRRHRFLFKAAYRQNSAPNGNFAGHSHMAFDRDAGKLGIDDITEETFSSYLDTAGIPDPDLLIRTSGEQRLSNYLLWQLAYTEFYFTEVHWPDFTKEELVKAVEAYNHRDRRYGGVREEA